MKGRERQDGNGKVNIERGRERQEKFSTKTIRKWKELIERQESVKKLKGKERQ